MNVLNSENVHAGHLETARLSPPELTRELVQHLGPTLVALIAGVRDRKLPHKWAQVDGPRPRDAALVRLQVAHRCWRLLNSSEGVDITRSWFIGANPRLEEESPAVAIREGRFLAVIAAADAFAEGSDS